VRGHPRCDTGGKTSVDGTMCVRKRHMCIGNAHAACSHNRPVTTKINSTMTIKPSPPLG
jgi:hypothetical protein